MDFIGVIILFFFMMTMCLGPWAWCAWRQRVRMNSIQQYKQRASYNRNPPYFPRYLD